MISIRGLKNKERFHLPLEIFYNSLHIRKKMRLVHSLNSLFIESYLLSLPLPPRKNVYYIIHDTRFSQPLCRSWSERERESLSILIFSARLGFQAGSMNSSVNVDTSPRILHLESGIRGWRGKSLLPANLARTSARKTCVH